MPIRDTNKLIEYHYARNPELKNMMDNIDQFSLNEIEQSTLPKWMRMYLTQMKEDVIKAEKIDEITPIILANSKFGFQEDKLGKIYRWIGSERFLKFGKCHMLVKTNDLLFLADNGIWLDTVYSAVVDPNLRECVHVKDSSFWEYKLFRKEELVHRTPDISGLPLVGDNLETTQSRPGVRIYRVTTKG